MVVSKAVYHELFQSALSEDLKQPGESEFEQRPFTRLAEYLDGVEEALRRAGFQALITFDEYERMEEGIESAKITTFGRTNARTGSGRFWWKWRLARRSRRIGVGRRFRVCYAKRLSKRGRTVIV